MPHHEGPVYIPEPEEEEEEEEVGARAHTAPARYMLNKTKYRALSCVPTLQITTK